MSSGLYSGVSGLALGSGLYRNVSGLWGGASGLINGFGGGGPFPGSSLYLDFLTPPLDSRITFSRGTNATLVDSTGKITYAPNNQVLYSQDIANPTNWPTSDISSGTRSGASVSVTAPEGYAYIARTPNANSFTAGVKYIFSITIVCDQSIVNVPVRFTTLVAGTSAYALVNTVAGVPQRIDLAFTPTATATDTPRIGIDARNAIVPGGSDATGYLITFSDAQLEQVTYQTTPGPYVATTASAYYGPRFDYDPVTLAPRGLLIEEARTNLLTYSDDWSNAAWTKQQVTITTNATLSPDGTANADKIVEDSSTAFHRAFQTITKAASAITYTYTVFVKAAERTTASVFIQDSGVFAQVDINLLTGALSNIVGTVSATNFGNGWWRVSVSGTSSTTTTALCMIASNNGGSFAGTAGFGIYAYGAQAEAGAFATSYIPTVASTVSRSGDFPTMTGTNFSSWYNQSEGTFIASCSMLALNTVSTQELLALDDGTAANLIFVRANNTSGSTSSTASTASVSQGFIDIAGAAAGVLQNIAYAIKLNDAALVRNGGTVTTDTTYAVPVGLNRMAIGARLTNFAQLNGHIRAIAYYNTRLPNTQLQTLTAPSLASPLALDFLSTSYTVGY